MGMRFVTLNGPLGCGKSWVVKNLKERYERRGGVKFLPVSFQDTLATSTMALLGAEHMDYATFKVTEFFGVTGRQWMINQATAARAVDTYFFSRVTHRRMQHEFSKTSLFRKTVFIADSNGFEDELDFMRVQADVDLLACSIEPPEYRDRRGQLYQEGDSRSNLAHKCTVVQANSTLMLDALGAALERRDWV